MRTLDQIRADRSRYVDEAKGYASKGAHHVAQNIRRLNELKRLSDGLDDEERSVTNAQAKLDPIKRAVEGFKAPTPVAMETQGYQAKQVTGPLPEFELARKRAMAQVNQGRGQASDALARRLAAMGQSNSGTAIRQQNLIEEQAQSQLALANEGIQAQEAQAQRELQAQEDNKAFQSGEAIKGRNFQRDMYNRDNDFKAMLSKFDAYSKLAQLDLAYDDAERSRVNDQFNKELAEYQKRHSGGLLGGGGFLGTGIGA